MAVNVPLPLLFMTKLGSTYANTSLLNVQKKDVWRMKQTKYNVRALGPLEIGNPPVTLALGKGFS